VESTQVVDGIATHNYSGTSAIPINGSPFLNDNFQEGSLELLDGRKAEKVLLRYNIAKDLFEILKGGDTLTLNRPFAVKYVNVDDKTFMFDPKFREKADRSQNGYFQLKTQGKLSLFIKRTKKLNFDSFTENYKGGSGTKEYYYIDKVNYVAQLNEGNPFLISSSKKFIAQLDNHKSEVKSFIKENKIKLKKEEDVIKLVDYYNTL